jgi:CarD family transcriptional regulator
MEPTFRVGDLAVYPAHGVAQIVGIETREISGNKQTFYILKILENGMKIMIPTRNAGAVGLRELIRADEVDEVFEILKSREVAVEGQTWNRRYREYMEILKSREVAVEGQTWNRRYREYMEKIKTGSVFEIAEVLRDLQRLKGDKELSFGERKMLDTARTLLIKEIAVATKSKEGKIEERLDRIFAC